MAGYEDNQEEVSFKENHTDVILNITGKEGLSKIKNGQRGDRHGYLIGRLLASVPRRQANNRVCSSDGLYIHVSNALGILSLYGKEPATKTQRKIYHNYFK